MGDPAPGFCGTAHFKGLIFFCKCVKPAGGRDKLLTRPPWCLCSMLLLGFQDAGHDALRATIIPVGKERKLWINNINHHIDRRSPRKFDR